MMKEEWSWWWMEGVTKKRTMSGAQEPVGSQNKTKMAQSTVPQGITVTTVKSRLEEPVLYKL